MTLFNEMGKSTKIFDSVGDSLSPDARLDATAAVRKIMQAQRQQRTADELGGIEQAPLSPEATDLLGVPIELPPEELIDLQ